MNDLIEKANALRKEIEAITPQTAYTKVAIGALHTAALQLLLHRSDEEGREGRASVPASPPPPQPARKS